MRYFDEPKQPAMQDWAFVRELTLPEMRCRHWSGDPAGPGEADLSGGITLLGKVPDPDGRLDSVYGDLSRLLESCGLPAGGAYPVATELEKDFPLSGDAFRITAEPAGCRIAAGSREGIRRGVYHFEDMLLAAGKPAIPLGTVTREPWLKSRISRCFFGPIKRPPLNRDELMDDTDYYPDEYLNRLAREGINGLWLSVSFRDLCPTPISPEYGRDAARRLKKLSQTAKKCLRYGIRIYIFCIEPVAWREDDPVLLRHPELGGVRHGGYRGFCPFSELAQQYLYEAVKGIFTAVPELGGMINISHGERFTTCQSSVASTENRRVECPRCGGKEPGEILRAALLPMEQGMHAAAPAAELISWLYMPQPAAQADWVFSVPSRLPENVVLQFNFESGCVREQLGKPRIGGDYWLSCIGPSGNFSRVAAAASEAGVPLSAKIQVGCSHEAATVPFVPVPSLLYRKYREMKKSGVSRVMQCWYFGNYPGVMNRAAGMLACEDFEDGEEKFLLRLARPDWGSRAPEAVRAWQYFAEGYSHYPLSNMFQYYGPVHDGVVWPLYLYPEYKPLAPTWKLEFGTSGDCIGECLENHTIDEAVVLCREMAGKWNRGVDILKSIRPDFRDDPPRLKDIALAEAFGIQLESGYHILRFYVLREQLFAAEPPSQRAILDEMAAIVRDEIRRSGRLAELCENDSRLGFHSEAEGYKYFPAKLDWRIKMLENLLAEDFPAAGRAAARGQLQRLPPADTRVYACGSGIMEECGSFRWKAECVGDSLRFEVECADRDGSDWIFLSLCPASTVYPVLLGLERTGGVFPKKPIGSAGVIECSGGWKAEFAIPLAAFGPVLPPDIRLNVNRITDLNGKVEYCSWAGRQSPERARLNLGTYDPQNAGLLVFNKKQEKSIQQPRRMKDEIEAIC